MTLGLIHEANVVTRNQAVTDVEGRTTYVTSSTPVECRIGTVSAREDRRASQLGVVIDAIMVVPSGTAVTVSDRVDIGNLGPFGYTGQYEVVYVEPTAVHVRVALRRFML